MIVLLAVLAVSLDDDADDLPALSHFTGAAAKQQRYPYSASYFAHFLLLFLVYFQGSRLQLAAFWLSAN